MSVQYSGDAATTRTSLGLGDAATKTTGTASGNIPVLDGSGQIASGVLSNAAVADNAITLAKMAGGTDGNLITYDASGDPAYVTTGTSGSINLWWCWCSTYIPSGCWWWSICFGCYYL